MERTRQIVAAVTVVGIVALAAYALWTPTQKTDLLIAPVSGPAR